MPDINQIGNRSNKRFNNKAKTADGRAFFEEPYSKIDQINPDHVWIQRDAIPDTPTGFTPSNEETVGVVKYNDVTLSPVLGTDKAFRHPELANIIPFDFGDGTSYLWTITHSVEGNIAFGLGDWEVVDGILVFNGTLPFSGGTLSMKFYSYVGQKSNKFKGSFENELSLKELYEDFIDTPDNRLGWVAIVGSTVYSWDVSENQWVPGASGGATGTSGIRIFPRPEYTLTNEPFYAVVDEIYLDSNITTITLYAKQSSSGTSTLQLMDVTNPFNKSSEIAINPTSYSVITSSESLSSGIYYIMGKTNVTINIKQINIK